MKNTAHYIIFVLLVSAMVSCSHSKKFTETYYKENEEVLRSIMTRYKQLYKKHPFTIEIKDKEFRQIGFEIVTDSIRYIYSFDNEPSLIDTLIRYKFDVDAVSTLINDMQSVHCTWITNLDYYEKREEKYLVFVSIRNSKLKAFLKSEKYFTLAYFDTRQYYDEKGRLLDHADRKSLHKINGSTFHKLTDRVCYSLRGNFR
jgi:hypothetical protein